MRNRELMCFTRKNMIKFTAGYIDFFVPIRVQMKMLIRQSYPCLGEESGMKIYVWESSL